MAVREQVKPTHEKQSSTPQIDPESLSTFRITVDEQEQESRDALRLPYEKYVISTLHSLYRLFVFLEFITNFIASRNYRNTSEQQTGYIHYQPDSDDDFDDEDPDEDLDI